MMQQGQTHFESDSQNVHKTQKLLSLVLQGMKRALH